MLSAAGPTRTTTPVQNGKAEESFGGDLAWAIPSSCAQLASCLDFVRGAAGSDAGVAAEDFRRQGNGGQTWDPHTKTRCFYVTASACFRREFGDEGASVWAALEHAAVTALAHARRTSAGRAIAVLSIGAGDGTVDALCHARWPP